MQVIRYFKTNHYPLNGNIPEEILLLEDGRAVYLNPSESDKVFNSLEEASDYAVDELIEVNESYGEYEVR